MYIKHISQEESLSSALENLAHITRQYIAPGIPMIDAALVQADVALTFYRKEQENKLNRPRYPHADEIEAHI